jgi:sugar lactone lactonase YvrE
MKGFLAQFLTAAWASLSAAEPPEEVPVQFVRGDSNADGERDLSDDVFLLEHFFLGGPEPDCLAAADSDHDGELAISDPIYHLAHLFLAGAPPEAPYPECGVAATTGSLPCAAYPPCEFETLASSYSLLTTVAGKGLRADDLNEWDPSFEGELATGAELSNPHLAMGDLAGSIYIADKEAHAIRKVTPAGRIFTVAGTNSAGDGPDTPGPATERSLNSPNGLWVRDDGTLYLLDLLNSKIRRVDRTGRMTTLISVPGGIVGGRGLWVRADESLVYFSSFTELKRWTPEEGVDTFAAGFTGLGNIAMDPEGRLVATDREAHRVYRLSGDGTKTPIAGNGTTVGGGDGWPALETGLNEVRAVCFRRDGSYFLGTHRGSQVWFVDTRGIIHLFLDGRRGSHDGDGEPFRNPGLKVSEVRAVTLDSFENLLVTENDAGFVRMVVRR